MFEQDKQRKPIRDFVFPLCEMVGVKIHLRGTAFLIGHGGHALTAAHVLDEISPTAIPVALFADDREWHVVPILSTERCEAADIAVVKLQGDWHSIFDLSGSAEHASCEYELWGYPERVAFEQRHNAESAQDRESLVAPDLIFNRGYVRRRISSELPTGIIPGKAFYELSEVAGARCSGAPIIKRDNQQWRAFGVYIGEETSHPIGAVGYAARIDALRTWRPSLLNSRLLIDERASLRD